MRIEGDAYLLASSRWQLKREKAILLHNGVVLLGFQTGNRVALHPH